MGKATSSLDLLVNTAILLNVEIKELFGFTHLEKAGDKNQIETISKNLSEEQRKLVIKLIKAVVN